VLVEQITGDPPAMPKNAAPLSPPEVDLIKRWIAEGAKDDTPPAAKDPIDQEHPPVYRAAPVISALVQETPPLFDRNRSGRPVAALKIVA